MPLAESERFRGADEEGIAGVVVDEGGAEFAILDDDFVAAGGVGPGFRAADDDGAFVGFGGVDPDADAERLGAVEVSDVR